MFAGKPFSGCFIAFASCLLYTSDGLYTKIVKNLNAQAQILGYHDYSELSYVRMNRIGYGPAEDVYKRQA